MLVPKVIERVNLLGYTFSFGESVFSDIISDYDIDTEILAQKACDVFRNADLENLLVIADIDSIGLEEFF
ncbi:hypothetical protein [Fibrella forsythiae]|uniref:Uncharacterized protein n=1 Tax=Fibrella forsythiae TaxID=2817061 RepID=A0ABS3JKV2_9BACT|nr:hypothetical protein [Fibrella forsythiae]MBO0950628.1 hypothetical protein [Fibrella forsythiae]